VSVRLLNRGDRPALVQVWLDKGDSQSTPDTVSVPFALSPTLARIDPERGQVLRLAYTGEPLPQDKESVFWLNVLEVPPKALGAETNNANLLQFALRTRIKVFYRPKGLKDNSFDAARALQWRLVRNGDTWSIEGRNASPYFVSVTEFSLRPEPKAPDAIATADGGMIGPGETKSFALANVQKSLAASEQVVLRYTFIDDYGALVNEDAKLPVPATSPPAAAAPQAK
jgi:P pilus assembly chaperone PapD